MTQKVVLARYHNPPHCRRQQSLGINARRPFASVVTNKGAAFMISRRLFSYLLFSLMLASVFPCESGRAQISQSAQTAKPTAHDGSHDFDFELGSWKIHLKRLLHPLSGSSSWVEFDGTSVTRKVWDGRSQLEEFNVNGPNGRIEGLTLRLYNAESHQWSLYWANSKNGALSLPPNIGEFKDGRGEFYCQDTFNGRVILVRYVWSGTTSNSPHFEQSYSDDGGKTWEVNWITDQTRVDEASKTQ